MKHSRKISATVATLALILAGEILSIPQTVATPTRQLIAQSTDGSVTVEGTLDSSSRQLESGNSINLHTFEGTEGEIVEITAEGGIQPYISILDPNRESFLRFQSQASQPTLFVLPQTGTYEIGVIAPEVGQTGDYQLTWQVRSSDEVSIEPFEIEDELDEQSLKLDDDSLINIYPLFGVAGEVITIELTADDFEPILSVQDPDRNLIQSQQASGDRASLTFAFPTTGNYRVGVISPQPNQTGSYQLSWEPASPEDLTIQPQSFEAQINDQSSQTDSGRLYNAYEFQARAGETVAINLTITTEDFAPVLILLDSEGNLLTSSQVIETETEITATLANTGTYYILVASQDDQTGSYQLSWQAAE